MVYRSPTSVVTLACLVALATPGCVHYQPRPLAAPDTLVVVESRALDSPDLAAFLNTNAGVAEWPPRSWNLETLTLAAFYYNPDLEVARADWAVARAGLVTAGERPNPDLSLAPGFNSTTSRSTITPWILTLNLDFTIETAGKRGHRLAQARHLSESSRLAIASAAWQVRSRLRESLLALFAATETSALLQAQRDLQADVVSLLERQLSAGAISPFEATQARIALGTLTLAVQDSARQSAEARVRLAGAIGVPVRALDGVALDLGAFRNVPGDIPDAEVRRQALLNRSDILGALAEYGASQAALQLEIARQYPDVRLGPGYEMDQADNKWSVAVSLPLPVFRRNRGPIAEAEARRTQAAARVIAVQARAITSLDGAMAAYRSALGKAATAGAMVVELQRQERSARAMFEAGEVSRLDLDVIRLQLSVTELARLDSLVAAHAALGSLEDAIQRPTDLAGWVSAVPPAPAGLVKR